MKLLEMLGTRPLGTIKATTHKREGKGSRRQMREIDFCELGYTC